MNSTVSLIMSAYNEEGTIGQVLNKLRELEYLTELIIVDNGSVDTTNELILEAMKKDTRIKLFKIDKNRGLGVGLRLAIENSSGDIVVRQDADLEYDPNELINLVRLIDEDTADVVYGSRLLVRTAHKVHYFYSYLANKIITLLSNIVTNLFLSDVETAAKAFRGNIIRNMKLSANGFEIENEITIKLKKLGCTFYEIPFSYYGRKFSEGKKIRSIDGVKAIYFILYYSIMMIFRKPKSLLKS